MKLIFTSFLFFCLPAFSQIHDSNYISKSEVNKLVNEISEIIRNHAIVRDSFNWDVINPELEKISADIHSTDSLVKINRFFTLLLRKAGDKHSFFITGKQISHIKNEPKENSQAESKYLEDGIGYIKVPACLNFNSKKDQEFANNIRRQIKRIDQDHPVTGWIVDLRQNTGGNMWPMLAGLNALIKDGTVGYFVYPSTKKEIPWKSTNGHISFTRIRINKFKIKDPKIKITVLIDSLTASSGEMTAISFSGLPNVRFFGTPSAGYTTANQTFNLSNGNMFLLATSFVTDRNHKEFRDKIIPDEIIVDTDTKRDETIEAAKKWLKMIPR